MVLIADSGSTKTDWILLDRNLNEVSRTKSLGLNPSVLSKQELSYRISKITEFVDIKNKINEVYFYGAGCGTPKPVGTLQKVMQDIFVNAKISIAEDMIAAVYASSGKNPAIVCILGTGSNSCYFNGHETETLTTSLGYTIMDEASGNYFGKKLLRDYFYKKMPKKIAKEFEKQFNLDPDFIKLNLYKEENPNMYLASFAKFMFNFKNEKYVKKMIKKGFQEFFNYRVLPYKKTAETPIYFIGSIAFYFREILEKVANKHHLKITDVIQRPIDNLLAYHKRNIN